MNSRGGGFVGAHTHRATPVPIPNTAVKPVGPMILLQRESRSVPALKEEPLDRKVEGFFVGLLGLHHIVIDHKYSRPRALRTFRARRRRKTTDESELKMAYGVGLGDIRRGI